MELEKLSALRVKRASKPGLYGDGHGLYLRVGDGNAKSWVLRYMLSGVAHSMGIGAVADFSLAEARERAAKYRKLAKQGIDPIEARRAERTGSSAQCRDTRHAQSRRDRDGAGLGRYVFTWQQRRPCSRPCSRPAKRPSIPAPRCAGRTHKPHAGC